MTTANNNSASHLRDRTSRTISFGNWFKGSAIAIVRYSKSPTGINHHTQCRVISFSQVWSGYLPAVVCSLSIYRRERGFRPA
ncbi:hypothetical protein DYI41_08540 [Marinobacter salarius]|nr:hypothetical protein [Marinobacter salarius]